MYGNTALHLACMVDASSAVVKCLIPASLDAAISTASSIINLVKYYQNSNRVHQMAILYLGIIQNFLSKAAKIPFVKEMVREIHQFIWHWDFELGYS